MKKVYESYEGLLDVDHRFKWKIYDYSQRRWMIEIISAYTDEEDQKIYMPKKLLKKDKFSDYDYIFYTANQLGLL
ncbi:MAG: hypothetical protein MR807_07145 [Erysipelotrichaceae bacterium]|nr:hypothetical protein [Erysipelotrichaceae bacterium]